MKRISDRLYNSLCIRLGDKLFYRLYGRLHGRLHVNLYARLNDRFHDRLKRFGSGLDKKVNSL